MVNWGLEGRVAVVSGAGRGVGRGLALAFAADGVSVVVNDIDAEPAHDTVREAVANGGQAVAVVGDVTEPGVAERMAQEAVERYGDLHIVATCAGWNWDAAVEDTTDEQWEAMIGVHSTGTFRVVREGYKLMRERAQQEQEAGKTPIARKIVAVSSGSFFGTWSMGNYAAGKAGIVGLIRTVALEGARFNILANAMAFGLLDTRLTKATESQNEWMGKVRLGIEPEDMARYVSNMPRGRIGTIAEAIGPMLFLASDYANYISGELMAVNGAARTT